jgi:hypothetical protein
MKQDTYYFSHDYNAVNDEKILYIRSRFGMRGYGLYWFFIEKMHESTDSKLTCFLLDMYGYQVNEDISFVYEFYQECIKIKLFVTDDEKFWNERVLINKQEREEKRLIKSIAGKKGMENRWKNNNVITEDNTILTKHNKGKEIKGKEIKEKDIPLMDEFLSFCKKELLDNGFNYAELEYALKSKYESWIENNWKDGHNNEIKNWKSKIKNTIPHLKSIPSKEIKNAKISI